MLIKFLFCVFVVVFEGFFCYVLFLSLFGGGVVFCWFLFGEVVFS